MQGRDPQNKRALLAQFCSSGVKVTEISPNHTILFHFRRFFSEFRIFSAALKNAVCNKSPESAPDCQIGANLQNRVSMQERCFLRDVSFDMLPD